MSNGAHSTAPVITIKDAYEMYQKHSEGTHKLWGYFSVISLAVLGYTIGTDKNDWAHLTFVVIGLSYFLFAFANRYLLVDSQREVERFALLFNSLAATVTLGNAGKKEILFVNAVDHKVEKEILFVNAVDHKVANFFHWGATVVVLLAILLTWWQKACGD